MAINKEGNGYTFLFAIILVVVVGSGLAALSVGLKPRQTKNVEVKKKMDILSAVKVESDRKNAEELYDKYIVAEECVVIDENGNKIGDNAFDVDIKKEFRNKALDKSKRQYPLYVANIDGSKKFIMPMVGKGLWGPIWGYVSVNEDKTSIFGAVFDHKSETPGLGAEIKTAVFTKQFETEVISVANEYKKIKMVKDGSGSSTQSAVDGITGGTITSKGVEEMLDRTIQVYVNYFTK